MFDKWTVFGKTPKPIVTFAIFVYSQITFRYR